ncbi:MAG: Do family serine endopeptidase [Hyphomicrobiaceae bacterium]|nr:Do family serine endopeptidase [Hyphomicrobiaceae bacterium]
MSHPTSSFLARHRRALTGGAVALGLAGLIGAQAIVSPLTPANAQTAPANRAPLVAAQQMPTFADVVERVRPAVVSIRVRGEGPRGRADADLPELEEGSPLERFFRDYGMPGGRRGERGGPQRRPVMGQGSGFIISADGKVVTNYHVVRDATEVTVVLDDQREVRARVLGADEKTDIALVKIDDPGTYPTVPIGNGDIRVGDWVVAVGNPFGLGGTVTAGIVSARGRDIGAGPYDDYLQIDAPINRGNSGGPTFNLAGEVVGVNTAIYSPSGGSVGIGFAIPADTVKRVVAQLEKGGEVVRGWLGVQIQPVNRDIADSLGLKDTRGALVSEPQAGSPAAKAGIRSGDVIIAVDGRGIDNARDLARRIADFGPGSKVAVTLSRAGKETVVDVTLGRLPTDRAATVAPSAGEVTGLADLGLTVAPARDVGQGEAGVVVTRLDGRSPAARQGLRVGDVILEIQGVSVASNADVVRALEAVKADGRRSVLMRVQAGDRSRYVAVPLAAS